MFTAKRHRLLRMFKDPPCRTLPAGDASPLDTGCSSRGLSPSGVPATDSPPGIVLRNQERPCPTSGPANTESLVRCFNHWVPEHCRTSCVLITSFALVHYPRDAGFLGVPWIAAGVEVGGAVASPGQIMTIPRPTTERELF